MNPVQSLKDIIDDANLWQKEVLLQRSEFLKMEGEKDTNLYYIVEGSLRIYFQDDAEEHTIRLGYQGNIIGDLGSFVSEAPSDLYLQALKKCSLLSVQKSRLMEYLKTNSDYFMLWHQILEMSVLQQLEREKDILIFSPQKRYERVLARSPQLFQHIPNKYIASYLRMTPETLSRLKKS